MLTSTTKYTTEQQLDTKLEDCHSWCPNRPPKLHHIFSNYTLWSYNQIDNQANFKVKSSENEDEYELRCSTTVLNIPTDPDDNTLTSTLILEEDISSNYQLH